MDHDHQWTEEIEKRKGEAGESIEKAKNIFAEARDAALRELENVKSSQSVEQKDATKPDPPAAGK